MKQILWLILGNLFFFNVAVANSPVFNHVVFFGDSLSDNGNIYRTSLGALPKSPPYFKGRFTNGPVWTDQVSDFFLTKNITTENYAVGGETAILHNPTKGFLPYTLTDSIGSYKYTHLFKDKSKTLFIIWIGGNDYLPGATNADQVTTDVVNRIKTKTEELIAMGGTHFLILSLPDLAMTPHARVNQNTVSLHELAMLHNQKLAAAIKALQANYPQIQLQEYDIFALFNDVLAHPTLFNEKYGTQLKDIDNACWPGGYRGFSKDAVFTQNPDLNEALRVEALASQGQASCPNPEEHAFWDHVHPSQSVHYIFYRIFIDYILPTLI